MFHFTKARDKFKPQVFAEGEAGPHVAADHEMPKLRLELQRALDRMSASIPKSMDVNTPIDLTAFEEALSGVMQDSYWSVIQESGTQAAAAVKQAQGYVEDAFQPLRFYNHNHGHDGRFVSGPGGKGSRGGFGSGSGAAGKAAAVAERAKSPSSGWGDRAHEIAKAKVHSDGMHNDEVLRAAFEGTFAELQTKVTHIAEDKHSVHGQIYKDGQKVGEFIRIISKDGKTIAHQELTINNDLQGGGFAREFNRNAENHYIANGVTSVILHANITVGGYAWARQGFDFKDDYEASLVKSFAHNVITMKYERRQITIEERNLLRATLGTQIDAAKHSWDIASLRYPDGRPAGKDLMLGSGWNGIKKLSPDDPTMIISEEAYQSKAKK